MNYGMLVTTGMLWTHLLKLFPSFGIYSFPYPNIVSCLSLLLGLCNFPRNCYSNVLWWCWLMSFHLCVKMLFTSFLVVGLFSNTRICTLLLTHLSPHNFFTSHYRARNNWESFDPTYTFFPNSVGSKFVNCKYPNQVRFSFSAWLFPCLLHFPSQQYCLSYSYIFVTILKIPRLHCWSHDVECRCSSTSILHHWFEHLSPHVMFQGSQEVNLQKKKSTCNRYKLDDIVKVKITVGDILIMFCRVAFSHVMICVESKKSKNVRWHWVAKFFF